MESVFAVAASCEMWFSLRGRSLVYLTEEKQKLKANLFLCPIKQRDIAYRGNGGKARRELKLGGR
jgi:hypothetical protein